MRHIKKNQPDGAGLPGVISLAGTDEANHITSERVDHSAQAQRSRLLAYLRAKGSVSTPEAREILDIPHPAGRINELRNRGESITTVRVYEEHSGGTKHRFGRYILQREAA